MRHIRRPALRSVRITGGFWKRKTDVVAREMVPYQWDALNDRIPGAEPSHALENFRIAAGEAEGSFRGTVFQDSDVGKWIEAASYVLAYDPSPELEARIDEAIRLIGKAQRPDGYVNTYFTVEAPEKRWSDLAWAHELYCAGHLIEGAVAHFEATGKTNFLDIMRRYADCIDRTFGPGPDGIRGCCGHPEIELALFRLYRATGEKKYRNLAVRFLDERGRDPAAFKDKLAIGFDIDFRNSRQYLGPDYFSAHEPVRAQRDAEGHAVRAMYLYAAMADEYAESRDSGLLEALRALWQSAVSRRMYITGGLGSQAQGERFTIDYDLPSDTAYAETCASIGLAFWASRMSAGDPDARYADAVERVIYNGALSGVSLDGTRFFYVNPLEVDPAVASARQDHAHVRTGRVPWFGCACCPPNLARLIASIGTYLYGADGDAFWVHQYAESESSLELASGSLDISQKTDYPWSGKVVITLLPDEERDLTMNFRIPGWCGSYTCAINGAVLSDPPVASGYLTLTRRIKPGDRIELDFAMPARLMGADTRIAELAGKVALQRGPLVYCLESCDNGQRLHEIALDPHYPISAEFDPELMGGSVRLLAGGYRTVSDPEGGSDPEPYRAYSGREARAAPVRLTAIPYHQWGNREPGGEMRVWVRVIG